MQLRWETFCFEALPLIETALFAPEREAKMPPHAYKPFGNGQRACIGRQFAMTEATLVLGMILQRFKLVDHTRYQLKIKESLTIKPEGLVMRVRLRPDVVRGSGVSVVTAKPAPRKAPKKAGASHGGKNGAFSAATGTKKAANFTPSKFEGNASNNGLLAK